MKKFGTTKNNEEVYSYTIFDKNLTATFIDYGATLISLKYKDKDIVLGYDNIASYEENGGYLGATVGRYANRINKGEFVLNDTKYKLNINDGSNNLHGGINGFDSKIWKTCQSDNQLIFSYTSCDMEENFPGTLKAEVKYTIKDDYLVIEYNAVSDKDTICNLTNHTYFNLNGAENGDILDHKLKLNADYYTPVNSETIPTGEIKSVKGTPYDFTSFKEIKKDFNDEFFGYDENFCLNKDDNNYGGTLLGEEIKMDFYTDMPGVQLYTGNFLNQKGKNDVMYNKYYGLCLETQFYPDSPNNENFPSAILKAGEKYSHITKYSFKMI